MNTVKIIFCPDPNYDDHSLGFEGNIEFPQEMEKVVKNLMPKNAKWSSSPCPLGCNHEQYEFEIPVEKFTEILNQLNPIVKKGNSKVA